MVNRLPNVSTSDYRHAIPILIKHLRRDYSDGALASLARSLATKEAQEYWDESVAMYKNPLHMRATGQAMFQRRLVVVGAENGDPVAQYNLYKDLVNSDDDLEKRGAECWSKKAAAAGDKDAKDELKDLARARQKN